MFYKRNLLILLLIVISFFPLLDLFHPGLPLTHDGQDHVARIANFYQNLQEGVIVPRWAANLNWGYGHPILMFLYPLPSYVVSLFHFFGFSIVDSLKILFGASFVLSGFSMYLWISSFLNRQAALLAAALYIFAPYRFIDLYVRGAIGEHVVFVFPPLVFYFLLKLSRDAKWIYIIGGSLSIAGFILSHNAITLMFLPLIFLYGFYLLFQSSSKKYFILNALCLILLGFGLSSFFWIPAFFEGKYTLRDIVTAGEYALRFVKLKDLLYGSWNYGGSGQFTVQLGIVHWIAAIAAIFGSVVLRRKAQLRILIIGILFYLFFTLYLMTEQSAFIWERVTTLQKFQFPWRFLSVAVFLTSVLGGIVLFLTPKKLQYLVLAIAVGLTLWFSRDYWHAKGFLQKEESFYTSVYDGTTDTGESAPIWSVRFMLERPKAPLEIIEGSAIIQALERTSIKHRYIVIAKEKTRLRENTLYFPGWFVHGNGRVLDIEFQDPQNRGLITFWVNKGTYDINIVFIETKLRFFANVVSGASLVLLLSYAILKRRIWQHFQ